MTRRESTGLRTLPGRIASGVMIFLTALWTFWSVSELYHEGWWGAWTNRLPYLVPIAVCLFPALLAFARPIAGGAVIVLLGIGAAGFFGNTGVLALSLAMAVVGALFIADGVLTRRAPAAPAPARWWRRHLRGLLLVGIPLLIAIAISAASLPRLLARVDDGDRSARLIEGNGVALVWAPEGPGWNWRQPWGGYPSWQSIALYGVPPVGLDDKPGYGQQDGQMVYATAADMAATNLCRYLNAEGTALLDTPQDIWRMPTADEVVRSLVHHGRPAGCTWSGEVNAQATCELPPDKESPLWASDHPAIYLWTADAAGDDLGVFVAHNGWVNRTRKTGGNPRHGYRCVRAP